MRIYERYRQCQQFAVITSGECLFWKQLILTSTLESIAMLDRTGSVVAKLQGSHLATCMALHSNNLAVGYQDGSVRVWDLVSHSFILFNGHKSAITSLAFDSTGTKLASADIDIVLWDIVAETGILRFKGHKDNITCLLFLNTMGLYHLLSGSKDSILKVWDIAMQQCVENVVSHRGEIWAMDYLVDEQITLFTGAADGQVRVWSVNPQILFNKFSKSDNLEEPIVKNAIELIGNLDRESKERILSINVYSNSHIGIQGADRVIDIFKKKTAAEIKKTISRRKKRAKTDTQNASNNVDLGLNDKISIIESIRCSSKVKSFAFLQSGPTIKLVASLANNSIEVHEIAFVEEKPQKSRLVSTYDLLGHRSDIRTLCLSSDDELLASGSSDLLKIWSTSTSSCLNTIPCGYALCSTFVPGNKYVIIGTKAGTVEIYDLASSSLVECIQAHEGPIWSLQQRPDQKGIVSGSQDKEVKFWDYRMVLDENYSKIAKRMTLYHTRTLKLHDDVLCVRVSPDGKLLAVALLDLTVKVFYMDTLKFFLSLYGHKLPVISMDIAYDSKIIITASSDKSVKIWGLDFGDCHKSLLAHSDSVMSCNFVWGTYFFFTASKDKTIKYWDAEKFEEISTLRGHHSEVWALAVAKYGSFIASASHDRSIRIWEKTDEQFVLQEEREEEMEKIYDQMDLREDLHTQDIGAGAEDAIMQENDTVGAPTKATSESLKAGDMLYECLTIWESDCDLYEKYTKQKQQNPQLSMPNRNALIVKLGGKDLEPDMVILKAVRTIRSSQLAQALLTLPFPYLSNLLIIIKSWVDIDPYMTSRILTHVLQNHFEEVVNSKKLRPVLLELEKLLTSRLTAEKDRIGFNASALMFLNRELKDKEIGFLDETEETNTKRKKAVTVVS